MRRPTHFVGARNGWPSAVYHLLVALLVLQGCATFVVERETGEGPTAEEVWKHRFALANRRTPRFEERLAFQDQLDLRMRRYLASNPEAASSLRVSNLRFWYQASTGMTKEEVRLLLDAPDETTADRGRMEALARKFWPRVKEKAKEAWTYPGGWALFFDGDRLVTLIQYRRQFLQE